MASVLLITSSPRGAESVSSTIATELAQSLSQGAPVTRRDLGSAPIPHLDSVTTAAIRKAPADRSPAEAAAAALSDQLIAEVQAADVIVLATGLINFGLYSTLKSWIDQIARAGVTFRYTEKGPVGLVTGKKVYVVLSSGGIYSQGPAAPMNHAAPYLKTVLGFLGMVDVEILPVEGLGLGPDAAQKAIAAAKGKVQALAAAA